MDKIYVVFWTQGGNTQAMAEAIGEGIREAGKEAEVVFVTGADIEALKAAPKFALGCPAMGVTGAAVATVIGQCVAAVVAFTCNHKFNTEIKIRFQGFRPDIKIIGTIYAIGVPSIISLRPEEIMKCSTFKPLAWA